MLLLIPATCYVFENQFFWLLAGANRVVYLDTPTLWGFVTLDLLVASRIEASSDVKFRCYCVIFICC